MPPAMKKTAALRMDFAKRSTVAVVTTTRATKRKFSSSGCQDLHALSPGSSWPNMPCNQHHGSGRVFSVHFTVGLSAFIGCKKPGFGSEKGDL